MRKSILDIIIEERAGISRECEPVTYGVPFPKGMILESSELQMQDGERHSVAMAVTPLAKWTDGSIKWLLFDLQVSLPANGKKTLRLYQSSPIAIKDFPALELQKSQEKISVHTANSSFEIDPNTFLPFSQITVNGHSMLHEHATRTPLLDEFDKEWEPHVDNWNVEIQNPLRTVLAFEGPFMSGNSIHKLRYKSRIHFFAGKNTARVDFTLWNPRAAQHPGGIWDLGDKGSILFRALSCELAMQKTEQATSYYALDVRNPLKTIERDISIYQDSSGGENWTSHNHINRHEKIPVSFRGFEVRRGQDIISQGLRTTPLVASSYGGKTIAATIRHFWQNSPKALEFDETTLKLHLFPKNFQDLFELQGGEQKTHTFYVNATDGPAQDGLLDRVHEPLIPQISSEWYYASGACPRPVPLNNKITSNPYCLEYQDIVNTAIHSDQSFFARREIIDEYGWRNFGDIYAEHEAIFHKGTEEFVSHYNNQYDVIKGAIIQFMRTGKYTWFRFADEYTRHVIDIDVYHTDRDRYEYNGGMFWHTDHHLDAATSTHRTASRKHQGLKPSHLLGTGPSPSHIYTTGILYHYWLTGAANSKEGVLTLGNNIFHLLEGSDIFLEHCITIVKSILKKGMQRFKQLEKVVYVFDGPGRASGNALNTLLDAYLVSSETKYMRCAEKLIRQCVAPDDDIESRDLLNPELRWMYTIFLQSLGRYLDIKFDIRQLDPSFWYARTVLLNYAAWMSEHEYPYLERPENLEFPNETWAAQEIRKSEILAHAAKYAPEPIRQKLLEKSRFFFDVCIKQLRDDFKETKTLTRVIAILMTNGMSHLEAFSNFSCLEGIASKDITYSLGESNVRKNNGVEVLKQFITVLKNTSFTREFNWLKQRLEHR